MEDNHGISGLEYEKVDFDYEEKKDIE